MSDLLFCDVIQFSAYTPQSIVVEEGALLGRFSFAE